MLELWLWLLAKYWNIEQYLSLSYSVFSRGFAFRIFLANDAIAHIINVIAMILNRKKIIVFLKWIILDRLLCLDDSVWRIIVNHLIASRLFWTIKPKVIYTRNMSSVKKLRNCVLQWPKLIVYWHKSYWNCNNDT